MLTRRRLLGLAGVTVLGGAALGGALVAGAYRFGVSRHRRVLRGLARPVRVVQLSDLHFGPWIHGGSVSAWVGAANREKPDLIVVTGDLLDSGSHADTWRSRLKERLSGGMGKLLEPLRLLQAPLGVWAVWGNHDYGSVRSDLRALEADLKSVGVQVLTNRGVSVRPDLYLAGVDDLWWGQPDARRAVRDRPPGAACLMLCHNPDYLFDIPASVGLTLCGHTHGGQVHVPGVGAPWTPSRYGERFVAGWIDDPAPAFVSAGLGVSGLPLRNVAAEVVAFEFTPAEGA